MINNNAYRLDLPEEYGVSINFNISHLILFAGGADTKEEEPKKFEVKSSLRERG